MTGDTTRPPLARPRLILLVFTGGVFGTAAREAIALAVPAVSGFPWAVLLVNLVGAFLLGLLITRIAPRRRDIQTFAGTGFLGGFTTYSALAVDTTLLLGTSPVVGVVYALISVVAGVACAATGIAMGSTQSRRHPPANGVTS